MSTLLVRRGLRALVVIFGSLTLVFFIGRLSGDPVLLMVAPGATAQDISAMRHSLGLDQPLALQFARFLGELAQGDLGTSLWQGQPVASLVLARLPYTASLTLVSLALAVVVAVPAGVFSAVKRNSVADRLVMLLALAGQSMPVFWLGLLLIQVFAVALPVLPSSGTGDVRHLILPAVTLGLFSTARTTRLVRSGLLEVLGDDHVRTARAKGLAESAVLLRHALRNALLPVVTLLGLEFGRLLGGAVITETIFAWPGVGRLAVDAISHRDFPLLQGIVLCVACSFVVINLAVDLLYGVLDPRIRVR
jgi:peptide/nickel transport system permease protein